MSIEVTDFDTLKQQAHQTLQRLQAEEQQRVKYTTAYGAGIHIYFLAAARAAIDLWHQIHPKADSSRSKPAP